MAADIELLLRRDLIVTLPGHLIILDCHGTTCGICVLEYHVRVVENLYWW